jgi:hypothetical protein
VDRKLGSLCLDPQCTLIPVLVSISHTYLSTQILTPAEGSPISALEKDHPSLPGYTQIDVKTVVSEDGRPNMSFGSRMSKALLESYDTPVQEEGIDTAGFRSARQMNTDITIVGSRGTLSTKLRELIRFKLYHMQVTFNRISL